MLADRDQFSNPFFSLIFSMNCWEMQLLENNLSEGESFWNENEWDEIEKRNHLFSKNYISLNRGLNIRSEVKQKTMVRERRNKNRERHEWNFE